LAVGRAIGGEFWQAGGNAPTADGTQKDTAKSEALRKGQKKLGNYRFTETILYVTLEPCAMCAGAIVQARVPRLVYGTDDPKGGAFRTCFELLTSAKLNHHVEVTPGVLSEEAASLLQSFFAARR